MDSVNIQFPIKDAPFDHNTARTLRLAALFHDCGHSCFSHISENLCQNLPDIAAATAEPGPYPGGHAHEVLSAMILCSRCVREYVAETAQHCQVALDADQAARWIVGQTDQDQYRYRTQVINGPFDADKLDYIFRDAHYSGLPVALDLYRLWATCKPEPIGESKILTLHQSGAQPLEQILFNKFNLFSIVYQHPKVRAGECMFQGVIEYAKQNSRKLAGKLLNSAADFLWLTDDIFFAEALRHPREHPLHQLIHDILYRRHLVRALTISKDTVSSDETSFQELLRQNHSGSEAYASRRALAQEIWKESGELGLPHELWVDLPPYPKTGETDNTYVRTAGGKPRKLSDLFPRDYWAQLYRNHKWRGHVFCRPEHQQKVYEASKAVFDGRFGLTFNTSAGEAAHVENP